MAGINDYSNTPASNTTINTIDVDEGCNPANINNAIRQLMADIADVDDGVVPLQTPDINGGTIDGATIGGTTPGAGTFTTATATTFSGSGASLTNIPNSALDNSSITINGTPTSLGGSIIVGDITGVTAGTGLSGGGTTGAVTLNVSGLTVNELAGGSLTTSAEAFADNDTTLMTSAAINDRIESFGYTTNTGDITGVTAGTGLSGGGSSGSVTLNVDLSELTDMTATMVGTDEFIVLDAGADRRKAASEIGLSVFNNDAGYTTNVGDITGVTAGTNLTGGGTSGTVTLNMATGGVGSGTYGSTSNNVKIDTIDVDAYGRVTAVATGATGRVDTVTAGDGLTGGGAATSVTLNVGAGTGVTVAADTVSIGQDVATSASPTFAGLTTTGNINFGDNDKAQFGASNDLQIYHDASHSYITDVGTGDLYIRGGADLRLQTPTSENGIIVNQDSSVQVYFNNAVKLTTTSTGIDVNGTVLTDKAYIAEATLTDGATISWNMNTQSVAKVTLGGNRTLAAPTNGSTGQFATITVIQDGTGSRTLTWNAVYEFKDDTAPTLTTTGGKGDVFVFKYNGSKWLEVGRNLNLTLS